MWAPYDPVSYFLHVGFGFLAVAGAIVALSATKGSSLHKKGGWTFAIPMIVAAVTSFVFEIEFDEPRPLAVVMAVAMLYLLATGILAIRHGSRIAPIAEKVLVVVPLVLFVFSAATLVRGLSAGVLALVPGTVLYATVFLSLVVGDVRLMMSRQRDRQHWIRRHLFRMLLAFAFAIRALFAIGLETGLPFEVVVTAPLLLALGATWLFFGRFPKADAA